MIDQNNDRLELLQNDLKLAIQPIELQNKYEIHPKLPSLSNECFVLTQGCSILKFQYFLYDLNLPGQLVCFLWTRLLTFNYLLYFLLDLFVFLYQILSTEYSIMLSRVLSFIIFSVVSRYPCQMRIVFMILLYQSEMNSLHISKLLFQSGLISSSF